MPATESLTVICDDSDIVVIIRRGHDGYPSGHGRDLAELLAGENIEIGSLAAQVVAKLVDQTDDIKLMPCGVLDDWRGYLYRVNVAGESIVISMEYDGARLFAGSVVECLTFCASEDEVI